MSYIKNEKEFIGALIHKMNWQLLKAQKLILLCLDKQHKLSQAEENAIEGVIGLLDFIQDAAIDVYGYEKKKVLLLARSEDDETPEFELEDAKQIVLKDAGIDLIKEDEIRRDINKLMRVWDNKSQREKLKKEYGLKYDAQNADYLRIWAEESQLLPVGTKVYCNGKEDVIEKHVLPDTEEFKEGYRYVLKEQGTQGIAFVIKE